MRNMMMIIMLFASLHRVMIMMIITYHLSSEQGCSRLCHLGSVLTWAGCIVEQVSALLIKNKPAICNQTNIQITIYPHVSDTYLQL